MFVLYLAPGMLLLLAACRTVTLRHLPLDGRVVGWDFGTLAHLNFECASVHPYFGGPDLGASR